MATLALDQQQLGGLHRLPPVQTVISCSGVQASARGASSDEEEQACGFVGIGAQPAHVASHPIHAPTPRGAEAGLTASFSVDSSGLDAACIASRAAVAATQGVDKAPTGPTPPRARPRKPVAVASSPSASSAPARSAAAFRASPPVGTPRGSSPAPAASSQLGGGVLPRRHCVLVAKQLTNSDASSGRIILPRVAVESNLSFVLGYRHYALAVRDCNGRCYEFMIKSWANGTEHRRVFVLEQAGEFLRGHGVGVGDAVGICTDENGELVVECNTEEVRQATVSPKYGALALAAPPPGAAAVPLMASASGRCMRSPHCTKAAGHPGFCSGPKAAAAAAAKQQQAAASRAAAAAASRAAAAAAAACCQPGTSEGAVGTDTSGEEALTRLGTPRHAGSAAGELAAAAAAAAASYRLPEGLHEVAHVPSGLRVCKVLTGYDLSSRRVVMPAPEVEEGLAEAPSTDLLTLAAVDEGQRWAFPTLRAWTNVAGRRGYLLDGLADWLATRGACAGDVLAVYRDTDLTPPRIEVRSADAPHSAPPRRPAAPDTSAPTFASLPLLLHPEGAGPATATEAAAGAHGRGLVLLNHRRGHGGGAMVCRRTTTCTKAAGHQGFCSGHKGFKRRESPSASSAPGRRGGFARYRESWAEEEDEFMSDSDNDSSYSAPSRAAKRPRRQAAAAAAAVVAAAASRDASPVRFGGGGPASVDPLLSLLSVLDMDCAADASGAATAAAEQAVLVAEAAADAAYDAFKSMAA